MIPFEIEVPYRMRPNMRPLANGEPITYRDDLYSYYKQQKIKLCSPVYGDNVTDELYDRVSSYLEFDSIVEATENYQEDFVVWAPNVSGELSAQILSVCFPSGWAPEKKVNKTFAEIHQPVADNKLIMASAHNIAKMITQKGPFVRSVWTISNSPELNGHPSVKKPWENEKIDQMYYRCERQVTVPMNDMAIFFIRTYVVPLLTVDVDKIHESIKSMTDEILTYKNLHHVKRALNESMDLSPCH